MQRRQEREAAGKRFTLIASIVGPVFKALADPTGRELLDELFRHDGQTWAALAGRFAMTRVAVAKYLRLLEDAGLVTSHRRGREKGSFKIRHTESAGDRVVQAREQLGPTWKYVAEFEVQAERMIN